MLSLRRRGHASAKNAGSLIFLAPWKPAFDSFIMPSSFVYALFGVYALGRDSSECHTPWWLAQGSWSSNILDVPWTWCKCHCYCDCLGVVLNKTLSRTEKIYTHGLHLVSTVDPETLGQQVCMYVQVYMCASLLWWAANLKLTSCLLIIYIPSLGVKVQSDIIYIPSLGVKVQSDAHYSN